MSTAGKVSATDQEVQLTSLQGLDTDTGEDASLQPCSVSG